MREGQGPARNTASNVSRVASGLAVVLSGLLAGACVGAFLATRVFGSRSQMGWDQLADFLGGFFLGALAGGFLGVILALKASVRSRWIASLLALLVAILSVLAAQRMEPRQTRPVPPPPAPVPVFEPAFKMELAASRADRALRANATTFVVGRLVVASENRSLVGETRGAAPDLCVASLNQYSVYQAFNAP